ncbi:MAG: hypothetical protein JKY34_05235 [Kordiimonadaceae bacterium]|nr:hypothetical protein [Kordiimonadaceae bacterium]
MNDSFRDEVMQLINASGEDDLELSLILSNQLVGLSFVRCNHGSMTCIMLDFGLAKRLWLQNTPTDFDEDLDVGLFTLRWMDKSVDDEVTAGFNPVKLKFIERAVLEYESRIITVGMRISFEDDSSTVDILSGQNICALAVFGWGFTGDDQKTEVALSEYKFLPW